MDTSRFAKAVRCIYMRTLNEEGPPEGDAERGVCEGECSVLGNNESRTLDPEACMLSSRAREGMTVLPVIEAGKS